MKGRLLKHLTSIALISVLGVVLLTTASAATSLKTGLKVFVIPKNLGNPYFTTADSVKSGGALKALQQLKESGTETSGTQATAASQIPAIQAAITKGANALIVSATDASALCPTLKQAMAKKIAVVTDAGAPVELVEAWRERGVEVVTAEPDRVVRTLERLPGLRRSAP